jgi:hypothetical protein
MPPTGAADVQRAGAALDHAVTEAARLQREIDALERQREAAAARGDAAALADLAFALTVAQIERAGARRRVPIYAEDLRRIRAAALRQLQGRLGYPRAQAEHALDLARGHHRRARPDAGEAALRQAGTFALGLHDGQERATAAAPSDPPPPEEDAQKGGQGG